MSNLVRDKRMFETLYFTSWQTTKPNPGSTSKYAPSSVHPLLYPLPSPNFLLTVALSVRQNRSNVQRVVALMIPGIVPTTLGIPQPSLSTNLPFSLVSPLSSAGGDQELKNHLPVFSKMFSHACPTKAPGEKNRMHSGYQSFTTCPLTSGEKDRREKARKERMSTILIVLDPY